MPTTTAQQDSFRALRDNLQTALLASFPEHVARIGWSRARIAAHQQHRLSALLAHAVEHSRFHARRLRGIDTDAVDARDLSQLPVMTKSEMMTELDDVFTDRRLTRCEAERALAGAGPEPATLLGSYLALTSGGSSGQRGVFVLDVPAAVQFFGTLVRGLLARLEAMGGPPPGGLPIAMVAAGSPVHATGIRGTAVRRRYGTAVQVPECARHPAPAARSSIVSTRCRLPRSTAIRPSWRDSPESGRRAACGSHR